MPPADNPFVTIDFHDVIRSQLLHIDEGKGGEADKDKRITHKGQVGILKLMGHDGLQFFLCQIRPFFAVRANVELCKWITGNLAIIVRSQNNAFQPHAALPDGAACQSSLRAEVGSEVLDEVGCQFFDERSGKAESG